MQVNLLGSLANSEYIFEINLQGENVGDLEFPTFLLCKHKRRLFTNLTNMISLLYCEGENVEDLEFPTFLLCKHKWRLFTNLTNLISLLYCDCLIPV